MSNPGGIAVYNKAKNKYERNPILCPTCNILISYDKFRKNREIKFCSKSCAAIFNNSKRKGKSTLPNCLYCNNLVKKRRHQYCSIDCHTKHKNEEYISRWKQGLEKGWSGKARAFSIHIRRYIFEKYDNQCVECGSSKIHPTTGNYVLQIDHIDGNCENNKEENLTLLCPTCHAMTPTYGSLNMGKSKRYLNTNGKIKNKNLGN